jgi:eukaryotic-like serine/threonine-protein kinase
MAETALQATMDAPPDPYGRSLSAPLIEGARYAAGELLGAGGMGEVRLFQDEWIGRGVATKTNHGGRDAEEISKQRFLREARLQGQLEHPSIVPVYDVGVRPDGGLYFTMRRVRGRTLEEVLDAVKRGDEEAVRQFSRRKLLTAFVNVCLAVHYAHTRGVVHRDLKPANVMLGDFGEVYVLDWGIAKVLSDAEPEIASAVGDAAATKAGALLGTPAYMAPEQLRGENDRVDARTDVYALGLILFELLTLTRARKAATLVELALLLGSFDARPSRLVKDIPPEIDDLCVRATSLAQDSRIGSARDLADAVEQFLDGDRELERRKALASVTAAQAEAAAEQALGGGASATEAQEARITAIRQSLHALALDADQPGARHALARLIVEQPAIMPPEVEAAQKDAWDAAALRGLRFGRAVYGMWLLGIPASMVMGVRSSGAFWLCACLTAAAASFAFWMGRTATTSNRAILGLAALHYCAIASYSAWLGPFVLVPVAAAVSTLVFGTQVSKGVRPVVIAMGALSAGLPYLVEALGVLPPSYSFTGAGITLLPRATDLPPLTTQVALIWMSTSFAAFPALYMGTLRDALTVAERKLFLQAWHLERLAADLRRGPSSAGAGAR